MEARQLKKYQLMQREKLIEELIDRDKMIISLEIRQKESETFIEDIDLYKEKLEEQIDQNQKAVRAFAKISEKAVAIIQKFAKLQNLNSSSLKSSKNEAIQKIFRNSLGQNNQKQDSIDQLMEYGDQDLQDSRINYLDEVIAETINILEYLSQITEVLCNKYIDLKNNEIHPSKEINSEIYNEINNDSKVSFERKQIGTMNQQIQSQRLQNKILQELVEQSQKQKKILLESIQHSISVDQHQSLLASNKQLLIQQIRKLQFRIKQLENQKKLKQKKSRVDKIVQKQKYEHLLNEVKIIKNNRRNGEFSMKI